MENWSVDVIFGSGNFPVFSFQSEALKVASFFKRRACEDFDCTRKVYEQKTQRGSVQVRTTSDYRLQSRAKKAELCS